MLVSLTNPWPGRRSGNYEERLEVAHVSFAELTLPSGRKFWVEVSCVCSVEDRGTRRRVRTRDQERKDVMETGPEILEKLEE